MASGSVMASTQRFDIEAGKTTNVTLDIRHSTDDVNVIGSFNSETIVKTGRKDASILSQTAVVISSWSARRRPGAHKPCPARH